MGSHTRDWWTHYDYDHVLLVLDNDVGFLKGQNQFHHLLFIIYFIIITPQKYAIFLNPDFLMSPFMFVFCQKPIILANHVP